MHIIEQDHSGAVIDLRGLGNFPCFKKTEIGDLDRRRPNKKSADGEYSRDEHTHDRKLRPMGEFPPMFFRLLFFHAEYPYILTQKYEQKDKEETVW